MKVKTEEQKRKERIFLEALANSEAMLGNIDESKKKALYEQVVDKAKENIMRKIAIMRLKDDFSLNAIETVKEASKLYGIHVPVVQKAYKRLEDDGYLYAVVGRGYFINVKNVVKKDNARIRSAIEKIYSAVFELFLMDFDEESVRDIVTDIYEGKSLDETIEHCADSDKDNLLDAINVMVGKGKISKEVAEKMLQMIE